MSNSLDGYYIPTHMRYLVVRGLSTVHHCHSNTDDLCRVVLGDYHRMFLAGGGKQGKKATEYYSVTVIGGWPDA